VNYRLVFIKFKSVNHGVASIGAFDDTLNDF